MSGMNGDNVTKIMLALFILNGVGYVLGKDQFDAGVGSAHAGSSGKNPLNSHLSLGQAAK